MIKKDSLLFTGCLLTFYLAWFTEIASVNSFN